MRHGIRLPAPGRAPGPSWHRHLLENATTDGLARSPDVRVSRGIGGTRVRLKKQVVRRASAAPVALTQTIEGLVVSLSAGIMIMRGALIAVGAQSVTLASGTNFLWLQFTITPATPPTPSLQKGSAWPTLDLGIYGYWPLSAWTVTSGVAILNTLYHPGGNIPYPVD